MLKASALIAQAVACCLGTVLLLSGGAGPVVAGTSAQAQASLSSLRVDMTFYQCVDPPEANCTAAGDEDKKSCPACRRWEAQRLNYRAEPKLRLETGPYHEQANVFLRDATESIYGLDYPTVYGRPVRVRDIYQKPEKFGWTEVPPESAGPGTLVAFQSSLGGVVVPGHDAGASSRLDVVFPSEKAGGALRQDRLSDLAKWEGEPKFLVPIALAESAAAARDEVQAVVVRSSGTLLDGAARARLEQLAGVLKTTGAEVSLAGYDASAENPAQNLANSEQLAAQAREYLVTSGVAPSQIQTLSSPASPPQAAQRAIVTSVTFQPGSYWNTWAEPVAPEADPALDQDHSQDLGYQRVLHLQPKTKYLIALQLSGFPYDFGEATWSLQSRPAGGDFETALDKVLAQGLKSPWKLRAVVFPGPLLRNEPVLIQQPLAINLKKIVAFRKQQLQTPSDPLGQLAADSDQPYAFGTLAFAVETGPDTGSTSLGISLWDEATNRPLDSIAVPLCIGEMSPCEKRVPYLGLDGPGLIDLGAGSPPEGLPDGSLHIFEMSGRVVGVFHRRDLPKDYPAWVISKDPQKLKNSLKSILRKFGNGEDPVQRGKDLAGQLFPQNDERQKKARTAFQSFLDACGAASPFPEQPPARLFVRMLLKSEGEQGDSVMFPIGLLHTEDDASDSFVGYRFRIEAPLPRQTYQSPDRCIADWLVVVPSTTTAKGDSELNDGRSALEQRLHQSLDKFTLAQSQMPVYEDFQSFLERLNEAALRGGDSAVVVVLSHHGDQDLSLSAKDNLGPESLEALPDQPFSAPSMAVLGSCSALTYGADQMVKVLNGRGVGTVIASNNQVSGKLAGNFLECLADVVEGSPAPEITASDLFYQAQRCLWEQKKEAGSEQSLFGPQVLSFSLVGNPSLTLCSQRKGS